MERPTYCVGLREGVFLNQPYAADQVVPVLILGNGRRGVVVGAQANGGICQTIPFARELAARGYHVAVFEWREPNSAAMAAATTALADAGAQRIVVGGFSEGAVIGLGEAPQLGPRVIGVMSISGGPSPADGYPTVQSVSNFRGPLLLISAKDDPVFPPGTSQAIAARHAGPEDLLVVPGSDHALALLDGEHAQEVRAAIYRFLARVTR
jgi:pimeloyl-ACP methyl ester carboxylesterase